MAAAALVVQWCGRWTRLVAVARHEQGCGWADGELRKRHVGFSCARRRTRQQQHGRGGCGSGRGRGVVWERSGTCRRLSSLVGRVRTRQLGEASTAPKAKGAPQTSPMNCFVRHHSQNIHDTPYMPAVLLATTCTPLPLCHYCHYRDPDNHTRRFARIFSPAFRAFCCYLPYHGP